MNIEEVKAWLKPIVCDRELVTERRSHGRSTVYKMWQIPP